MDEATVQAIREIAEALRADLSGSIDALSKRCDALAEDVKANKKSDEAGERAKEDGAPQTAVAAVAIENCDPVQCDGRGEQNRIEKGAHVDEVVHLGE